MIGSLHTGVEVRKKQTQQSVCLESFGKLEICRRQHTLIHFGGFGFLVRSISTPVRR